MNYDRGSQIADRNKVCDRLRSYGNILLRSSAILRSRSQTIAEDRTVFYLLRSSAINCDQLRLCDHMETKVLRSAIETHPKIFRVLSHDSTLVCSIVGTVFVVNVFIIAAAEILTTCTRTKRPAIGTKSGRRFIYRPRKRRPNFLQHKNCIRSLSNPKPMFSTVLELATIRLIMTNRRK